MPTTLLRDDLIEPFEAIKEILDRNSPVQQIQLIELSAVSRAMRMGDANEAHQLVNGMAKHMHQMVDQLLQYRSTKQGSKANG